MFSRLRRLLGSMRGSTLLRSDYAQESKQPIENTDALASAMQTHVDPNVGQSASFPPNYVRPTDEGRPRH
jgi:hypothetical protein